jgi:hypothetical protein
MLQQQQLLLHQHQQEHHNQRKQVTPVDSSIDLTLQVFS